MATALARMAATALVAAALTFSAAGCASTAGSASAPKTQGSIEATESVDPAQSKQADALEAYVAAERAAIPAVMEANAGVYSDVQIESAFPDTVVYTFTYAAEMDPAATAANLDAYVPTFQDSLDTSVFPAMASAGLEGTMHATYVYLNVDGSLIWQKDFASS